MPSFFPFPGSRRTLPPTPPADIPAPRPAQADPTLESVPPPKGGDMDLAWDDTQPIRVISMERPP
ncbi:hypothetical protein [Polyangium sorediatum]|uniref:Uncharacterized protein n=1 Tax=Polyangium sorediatum TaxID=889274 RepID=A0ABT6P6X8_9BACT|nr:hypothetical protein [Polyangium sorediatum]MDI1436306.1 hypothetical protein [Polyangium sorediatum]